MIRKTVSMPDEMGAWIEGRIQAGQYNNDSEYFRDLVRRDQDQQLALSQLRQMLQAAEDSGVSEKSAAEIWAEIKNRLPERIYS